MTTEPQKRINRRLITQKGRAIEDWWHPINEWLESLQPAPLIKRYGLVGIAESAMRDEKLRRGHIGEDDQFMVVAREFGGECFISAFLLLTSKPGQGFHIFDAVIDSAEPALAWRIAALFDNVFNGVILDPDHQDELTSLLFAT